MRAACCWSGGKDSCYALWKAMSQGHDVRYLVNFISPVRFGRNAFHGVRHELIRMQSESVGIPIMQRETTWEGYERTFREVMNELRNRGIEGLVTGDMDIIEHRTWTENICGEFGLKAVMPLWGLNPEDVLKGFVDEGFESIVVCVRADLLDDSWLGRRIDRKFMADFHDYCQKRSLNICGENGEYHTFVVDGPALQKRISITPREKVLSEGYWFLDIGEATLVQKVA